MKAGLWQQNSGVELPNFASLKENGWHEIEVEGTPADAFSAFRQNPSAAPLNTPSGKIEIYSSTIASFDGTQIMAHPAWYPPVEWLGNAGDPHPFHLISNQPAEKLHSQLDHGQESRAHKRKHRTPLHIKSADAKKLNINDGDTVRVFNARGAVLLRPPLIII